MSGMAIRPGIYRGTLRHRRMIPKAHEFTYPLFMVLLDIDLIPEMMAVSRFASYEGWNWTAYLERDHFGDAKRTLRERVEADARRQGVELPRGKIFLLTHLRYLGYNFNPVSFFYCCNADGDCEAVLAEVNNTFGETENYWLTDAVRVMRNVQTSMRYQFDKRFHVSPFMAARQQYDWTFTVPEERLVVESMNFEDGELVFDSTLSLERREWSGKELHRALVAYPMMTLKVIAAIHWHAIRLMLKRVPVVHHPGSGKFTVRGTRQIGASWKAE